MSEPEYRPPAKEISEKFEIIETLNPTAQTLEDGERLIRRSLFIFGTLVALVIIGVLGARPTYRKFKAHRAVAIALESGKLLEEGKASEALPKARTAYNLSPGHPAAMRALAKALAANGQFGDAFYFWKRLADAKPPLAADLRSITNLCLDLGDLATARTFSDALSKLGNPLFENTPVLARLKFMEGHTEQAIEELRPAVAQNPGDEMLRRELGQMLLKSTGPTHAEGEKMLRELGASPSVEGLNALNILAADPLATPGCVEWLSQALKVHPRATALDKVTAFALELRSRPTVRKQLITEAEARFQAAEPPVLAAYGNALIALGEAWSVLSLIPSERALTREDLLIVRINALSTISRWQEVYELLEEENLPLSVTHQSIFKANTLCQLGRRLEARVAWKKAFESAGNDLNLLDLTAYYAENAGEPELAQRTREKAAQLRVHPAPQRAPGQ